ncbi:hypothetical protein ACFE04_018398 [Oxalis oulophora]
MAMALSTTAIISSPLVSLRKTIIISDPKRTVSFHNNYNCFFPTLTSCRVRVLLPSAVLNDESIMVSEEMEGSNNYDDYRQIDYEDQNDDVLGGQMVKQPKPCEVYVCNLSRSVEIPDLLEMFRPFGTILSVEISRNPETGVSRGSGYVTMSSIPSAKAAIRALDGSDVNDREMRVRFAVEMNPQRNPEVLNASPRRSLIYESPYKLYVGNLHRAVNPQQLREFFSQYGTVVSVKVLHDQKGRKSRAFGFLSFSSETERNSALAANGSGLYGRDIVVRKGLEKEEKDKMAVQS